MTTISIMYPKSDNARFDMAYYVETHMPLAIKLLGACPGYKGVSVASGIDGPYFALCHFQFDSAENFKAAFDPHAAVLVGDIPNYTDVTPVFQVSEVLISR